MPKRDASKQSQRRRVTQTLNDLRNGNPVKKPVEGTKPNPQVTSDVMQSWSDADTRPTPGDDTPGTDGPVVC